jgi:hypothetical protein
MKQVFYALGLISIATNVLGQDSGPAARPFSIERLDPALDAIVSPDAELELLGDRYGLTEGPVWVDDGARAICSSAI